MNRAQGSWIKSPRFEDTTSARIIDFGLQVDETELWPCSSATGPIQEKLARKFHVRQWEFTAKAAIPLVFDLPHKLTADVDDPD